MCFFILLIPCIFIVLSLFVKIFWAGLVALALLPLGGILADVLYPPQSTVALLFNSKPDGVMISEYYYAGFSRVIVVERSGAFWRLIYKQIASDSNLIVDISRMLDFCRQNNIPFKLIKEKMKEIPSLNHQVGDATIQQAGR